MVAYWMAMVDVKKPENYQKYIKLAGPAIESSGGRFLARGGKCTKLEGRGFSRMVIVEFDSLQKAEECYHSIAYKEAKDSIGDGITRHMGVVESI